MDSLTAALGTPLWGGFAKEKYADLSDREKFEAAQRQFNSILAADRIVAEQLDDEVFGLKEELHQLRDVTSQLQQEERREREAFDELERQKREISNQLQEACRDLSSVQEARRLVSLDAIAVCKDRRQFSQELQFLQRVISEEEGALEAASGLCEQIQNSTREVEAQTQKLELQRKELIIEASAEQKHLHDEQRQIAELRIRLQHTRKDLQASSAKRLEEDARQRLIREMNAPEVPAHLNGKDRVPVPMTHSWAATVSRSHPVEKSSKVFSETSNVSSPNRFDPPKNSGLFAMQRRHDGVDF
eukprot:TRINITY_DN11513_c3_g1_i1.p1 TRINITY_DN11513_c3_g1~~TRINITY_DN11513_c3_g1_i1.p1  ORF type:complete len:314 (+),score=80.62 TRINITY_DN11513_c3_g1_i1:37-942(+)